MENISAAIFCPGNIDFCGDNCFKVTEPIAVTKRDFCIYTNTFNQSLDVSTAFPFYISQQRGTTY